MKYKVLKNQTYHLNGFSIMPLREQDIYSIKNWRNEQIDALRQKKPLTDDDQRRYYERVVVSSFEQTYPNIILVSFIKSGKCIGYGGLVHIDWEYKRGEISFLADTSIYRNSQIYSKCFTAFLKLMKKMVFEDLCFNRIHGETYDIRPLHISILEKNNFKLEGRMRKHVIINGKFVDSLIHGCLREEYFNEQERLPFNVLATSISRKIPMLKAIKYAAGKYGTVNQVYGADGSDKVIGKHFVDHFWKMPRLENLDAQTVINYCLKNNIRLIIPSRDGELPFWAKHKSALERRGITVMVSSAESVNICLDKLKFYQTLKKSGLPAIPTAEKIDGLKKASRYVVKERYGAGSQNIGLNLTKLEAINHSSKLAEPIFQPFISGKELSVDLYVSKKGKVKGVICRSRDVVVNGESQITTTVDNSRLEKLAVKVAEKLKLYGHVVLQVLMDSRNKFHIIECNSRFGGASTLSVQCGLDSFYWAMLEASGHDIDEYPFVKPKETRTQIRFPEDIVLYGASV